MNCKKCDNGENESLLSTQELVSSTQGMLVLGNGEVFFTSVQTDSRNVEKNALFVPLIGENQNGHKYIPQALEKGASAVLIGKSDFEKDPDFFVELWQKNQNVNFIAVENTLTALQKAAGCYVEKFPDLIKIAVTGSSGKTTTKEIAASILRQKFNVITNKGNLNSETGLPLSVFEIRSEHKAGIFEMGMNRENEIGEIAAVLKPRFALVTNIGTAHIGILGSRENIAREKAKVFNHFFGIGTGFIPKSDDFADFLADSVDGKVVFYGENCDPDVKFVRDLGLEGTELSVCGEKAVLGLPGKYNYINALGAVALGKALGLTGKEIAAGISSLKPMFGRSEVLKGKFTVIQDCYNANPDSMEKAIDFVSSVSCENGKILVLADMLELGKESKAEHEKTGLQAASSGCNIIIFAGNEMKYAYESAVKSGCKKKIFYVEGNSSSSIEKIVSLVTENGCENDIILVKGSRGMGLERFVKSVLEK